MKILHIYNKYQYSFKCTEACPSAPVSMKPSW